jgi:putative lipid kinase YegS-like protein
VTVERGRPWGAQGVLPADGVVVRTDGEARRLVEPARRSGAVLPVLGLLGGDLARSVGGTGDADRLHDGRGVVLPVDLVSVLLDGRQQWFVAHLVARRAWWRGRIVAVMNAQWHGSLDVAPRSHPNDGRVDVLDANMAILDRLKARRRLRTGTHVPHPAIEEHRVTAWATTFNPPLNVWLDGERYGSVRDVAVRVEPDALSVVV